LQPTINRKKTKTLPINPSIRVAIVCEPETTVLADSLETLLADAMRHLSIVAHGHRAVVKKLRSMDHPALADYVRCELAPDAFRRGARRPRGGAVRKCLPQHFNRMLHFRLGPPFYHPRFGRAIARRPNTLARPPDSLFYTNEQAFYLHFAYTLDYPADRHPRPSLPIAPSETRGVTSGTVVLAPGCKTGTMATKRWPYFPELAAELTNVVVVGTPDDLTRNDGAPMNFPAHVRSLVGQLSLRETAEVMAAAGVVVGNDSGLSHVAAAVGTPTVMLFGPTSSKSLGPMPPNVKALRSGLPCEPCWFRNRFQACTGKIDCLAALSVDSVIREVFASLL